MISISHWGQFPDDAIRHLSPHGYRFADHDGAEWSRPDGFVEIIPIEPSWLDRGDGLPVFWAQFRGAAMDGLRKWMMREK